MMKRCTKSDSLIAAISKRLRNIGNNKLSEIRGSFNERKTLDKVEDRLARWVKDGKHRENYDSMDEILDELGLTNEELSFYCSRVLKKKFLSWRKEMRIEDAKTLLIKHPEDPVCHIGYAVGLSDKSNFRRQFKDMVGCTPTEWRERQIKNL